MREKWWRSARLVGAVALPVVVASVVLGPGGLAGVGPEDRQVTFARPAWAAHANDRGPARKNQHVEARIWLSGRHQSELERYERSVSSPHDPLYRRFLSPTDFENRFGPTAAQTSAVTSWLRSAGMQITNETDHYVTASGPVDAAERAFSVSFHTYSGRLMSGISPVDQPRIPASLEQSVLTITGLDRVDSSPGTSLMAPPKGNRWPKPCNSPKAKVDSEIVGQNGRQLPWAPCGYTPQELRTAYGAATSQLTGKGVTVAVVGAYASPTIKSDLTRYSQAHQEPLRPQQYREILSPEWSQVKTCGPRTWYGEETKDVEAVHAMAPDAGIVYLGARDCSPASFNDALLRIVDLHLSDIVSASWGQPTDGYAVQDQLVSHRIFEQGVAEGIGFYFSAGDAGYEDPSSSAGRSSGSQRFQVDYPASDPLITAVGGTSLMLNADDTYAYETSWGQYRLRLKNDAKSGSAPLPGRYPQNWSGGTGGGTSVLYPQPWYQHTVVPSTLSRHLPDGTESSRPMRVVPDVALDADPVTGMLVGETVTTSDGKTAKYAESRSGGTSLSCPLFAGIQALAQQANGKPLGFANPAIYHRYGTSAYHDVTDAPLGADRPVAWAVKRYMNQSNGSGPTTTYVVTTGRDGEGAAKLRAVTGFDDTTGVGSPGPYYLDSYRQFPRRQGG
ncbi:S53 family serine peptidase [Streptomyces sp. NBC_00847]|uniref:S53 family peptidase n=1 Tax=Streptomyces sp. NBC_00847 TaxID=2975850 RepID=UPI00225960F7|nr:S53 family serine peptidase [Streptomyces sp. NBC_00847]MCX4881424.1 S53 family serine peptidase [Streptomyces sp. NBC_00847]